MIETLIIRIWQGQNRLADRCKPWNPVLRCSHVESRGLYSHRTPGPDLKRIVKKDAVGEGHNCFCTGRSRMSTGVLQSLLHLSLSDRVSLCICHRIISCVSVRLTASSTGRSSQCREKCIQIGGQVSIPDVNAETYSLQRGCFIPSSSLPHIARPNSDQGVATRSRKRQARTALPPCFDSRTASVSPGAFLQLITGSSRHFSSCGRSDRCIVLPATLDSAVRIPYSSATC